MSSITTGSVPDLNRYADCFAEAPPTRPNTVNMPLKYFLPMRKEDIYVKSAALGGNENTIDSVLEFAIASYHSPAVVSLRPPEAAALLPENSKTSALKLGMAVLKELTEIRFLDPSNTAAVGRYEGMIKFISDKNGVSRAEIDAYYRQGIGALIAEAVNAEFSKVSFMLDRKYNTTLTRNSQTGQYTLSYERPSIENDDKKITATSLDDLRAKMTASRDFTADGINLAVNEKAGYIPAVVYDNWQIGITNGVNGLALVKETITNFYLNPTQNNYRALLGIFSRYAFLTSSIQDPFAEAADWSLSRTMSTLNHSVYSKIVDDLAHSDIRALARIPADSRYNVFSIPAGIGGGGPEDDAAVLRESNQGR
ncbi:hypothetical protein NO1_1881 [Candidatus Termititenax aidoneus]|uniref:Uncharacterized protein n=1 Tax=Termititenax aidoneus TaxID=2218524 RepID=A0A388TE12_TERA1|nr:hypothetical protein NO1_1881 [Candidatus Termititenax aidoneus]